MWTNNGRKLICKQLSTKFTTTTGNASDFTFKGCLGQDIQAIYNLFISGVITNLNMVHPDMTSNVKSNSTDYYGHWILYIGTGTTPPTEEDYILENPVAFPCPVIPQISRGSNLTTLLITYTYQNDTEETKTITEIGLCARVNSATTAGGSPAVLFNRRLLDHPVVMVPGSSATFSFTIDTANLTE